MDRVARNVAQKDGPGAVPGAVSQVAERLIGFELQMGLYAVAELRTSDLLASYGAVPPPSGMRLYVTDTLDDPYATQTQMAYALQLIAHSRRQANRIKAKADVTVVIGNPPYKELAVGDGGWVENGGQEHGTTTRPILEDFFVAGAGRFKAKLKNLYIYFWRWATWKVWESTRNEPDGDAGIICFISTSGYVTGPAFTGMRVPAPTCLRRLDHRPDPGGARARHPDPDISRRASAARDRVVPAGPGNQRPVSRGHPVPVGCSRTSAREIRRTDWHPP